MKSFGGRTIGAWREHFATCDTHTVTKKEFRALAGMLADMSAERIEDAQRTVMAETARAALVEENARLRKALDACRDHFEDHEDGQMLGLIELALGGK